MSYDNSRQRIGMTGASSSKKGAPEPTNDSSMSFLKNSKLELALDNVAYSVLSKEHPEGKTLVRGVRMTSHSGRLFAVMGPSGAGKTTLLNIMAGEPGAQCPPPPIPPTRTPGRPPRRHAPPHPNHVPIRACQRPVEPHLHAAPSFPASRCARTGSCGAAAAARKHRTPAVPCCCGQPPAAAAAAAHAAAPAPPRR